VLGQNSNIIVPITYATTTANLFNVTIAVSGYNGTGPVGINFSGKTNYVYVNNQLNTSSPQQYQFLNNDQVSLSVVPPLGWNVTISSPIVNTSVARVNINFTQVTPPNNKPSIGGYYQSWSANWASTGSALSLSKIPSWVNRVLVAFATPSMTYLKGSNVFTNTGLQFSSDFSVVQAAITLAHQTNPNQKFILSVGGATYPWTNPNYQSMVDLMVDLGLDGIDIDFENSPSCTGVDTASLSCSTDSSLISIINNLRSILPAGKLLTAAVFSVGAYGTPKFPNAKFGPSSGYAGMWVNPLAASGNKLDEIFIMSYDASPAYSQTSGFDSYNAIFNGTIHLGLEVPPEAWGGYVLTPQAASTFASYVQSSSNGSGGVFVWSFQKTQGSTTANTYLQPICSQYGYANCSQSIPLN